LKATIPENRVLGTKIIPSDAFFVEKWFKEGSLRASQVNVALGAKGCSPFLDFVGTFDFIWEFNDRAL